MGTSVTNFMMHELGLSDCFGFAISDRGLSAPFFAFDSLYKYLQGGRRKGLLAIADQKHLLYKSDLVSRLNPKNSACIIRVDVENKQGFRYAGYARCALQKGTDGNGTVAQMLKELGLDQRSTTLIGPRSLLDDIRLPVDALLPTQDELVCSAPFAAFSAVQNDGCNYLLLCQDEKHVTALGFAGTAS